MHTTQANGRACALMLCSRNLSVKRSVRSHTTQKRHRHAHTQAHSHTICISIITSILCEATHLTRTSYTRRGAKFDFILRIQRRTQSGRLGWFFSVKAIYGHNRHTFVCIIATRIDANDLSFGQLLRIARDGEEREMLTHRRIDLEHLYAGYCLRC